MPTAKFFGNQKSMAGWELHTVNHNARNPDTGEWVRAHREYASRQEALDVACGLPVHAYAEFIKGPNGERIERSDIDSYCKSDQLVDHNRKSRRISLVAAGFAFLSALISAWLVATISDNGKRQLRAYVIIEKQEVTHEHGALRGVVALKNFGQTPAYALTMRTMMLTTPAGRLFVAEPWKPLELSRGIVGPGMTMFPRVESSVRTEDIPALQNGGQQIYVAGCVEYRDAFEQTWNLEFRFRSAFFEAPRWFMQPTSEGNEERPGSCGPRLG